MSKTNKLIVDKELILVTIAFLLISSFVPNVKSFFILVFLYFFLLIWKYSFVEALIYSSPILAYLGVGQSHPILVIPPSAIIMNQYLEGRHLSWGFTPYLLINLVAFLLIPFWKKKYKKQINLFFHEKILLILNLAGLLSAFYGSIFLNISLLNVVSIFLSLIPFYYLILTLINSNKQKNKQLLLSLLVIIVCLSNYEAIVVFLQMLIRNPVGILAESIKMAPIFGLGADENQTVFRPFGLNYHPNVLANQHLISIFTLLFLNSYLKKIPKIWQKLVYWTVTISIIVIIITLSRAAYIALLISFGLIYSKYYNWINKKIISIMTSIKNTKLINKLLIFCFLILLIFRTSERLINSIFAFSEFGGVNTRAIQFQEAWEVFKKSSIFGIGDRMFIPTSYQLFPNGVMTYFPEEVHQGFFLFIIERGLLGGSIYLIFLLSFLKQINKTFVSQLTKIVIYSGLIAGYIVMLFHPVRNTLTFLFLLVIALTHYEKKILKKN